MRSSLKLAAAFLAGSLLVSVILMLKPPAARAAPEKPSVEWSETYGGPDLEEARSVIQTSDGGFALAGYTLSYGAGWGDFWLVKLSGKGFGVPPGIPSRIPWALIGVAAIAITVIVGVFVYVRRRSQIPYLEQF